MRINDLTCIQCLREHMCSADALSQARGALCLSSVAAEGRHLLSHEYHVPTPGKHDKPQMLALNDSLCLRVRPRASYLLTHRLIGIVWEDLEHRCSCL